MLEEGDIVGVGLSGGADSVALLSLLVSLAGKLKIKKIRAIHVHHGIRGAEADRDMLFSEELCRKLGAEFVCFKADVPAQAKESKESIEECARRLRYSFFEKSGCDKIATAHNLNDNMETFLLNLARGSSLTGLCAIPYKRDKFIRPLLDCSRGEIEEYLKEQGLGFVTDSTNLNDDYTRNKIRHRIIPCLYEINGSFDRAFSKCLRSVIDSEECLENQVEQLLKKSRKDTAYSCEIIKRQPEALKSRIISMILKENGAKNINRSHILAVSKALQDGGSVRINKELTAVVSGGILAFNPKQPQEPFEKKLILGEYFETPGGRVKIEIIYKKDLQKLNKEVIDKLLDYDKITGDVFLRNRRNGDKYRPSGRNVTKTLKDLFSENKIPVFKRPEMLILCDDNGILWTEYFGASERCRISETTERFVKIVKSGE